VNVSTARDFVRQFARTPSGDTSVFTNADIDRSIQAACDDFALATNASRQTSSFTINSGLSDVLDWPDNCTPDRVLRVYLEAETSGVITQPTIRPYEDLLDAKADDSGSTGTPTMIVFRDGDTQFVWPLPDDAFTGTVVWAPPLTASATWTVGGTDNTTLNATLNLPDDHLRTILMYGAVAILQHTEIEQKFTSAAWQQYLEFRKLVASRVGGRSAAARVSGKAMIPEN
jgi:hypothetical protein